MTASRPNVLLISVHDLGTRLGCYGFDSAPSPNLDKLAAEGVRFERNFATATFCSPSRGAIITGKYPHTNGLMGLVNLGWDWDASNVTLARALGGAGYDTTLFGLQHEARKDRVADLGFQHVAALTGNRCGDVFPAVEDFLAARGAGNSRPFYARVGFFEVHRPFDSYTPEDPAAVSLPNYLTDTPGAREDLARYDRAIRRMDDAVGRVLRALDAAGLKENTLVAFTTDHGSPFPRAKGTLYDAGIHTALLLRWPAGFAGGRIVREMTSNIDLFPTVLEAADAAVPAEIQGRSFLPLLRGEDYTPRDLVFAGKNTHRVDVKRCVRSDRFKYIRNYAPGPALLLSTDAEISLTRRDLGNDHIQPRPEVELYEIEADPAERTNLAGRAEFAAAEEQLARRLRAIQEDTSDPLLAGPIQRPPTEQGLIAKAYASALARCSFSRDGLISSRDVQARNDVEFAEPRATFCR
jgi:arylsulfatase A-like enzyme